MKNLNKFILGIALIGFTYSCTDLEEDLVGDLTSDFSVRVFLLVDLVEVVMH